MKSFSLTALKGSSLTSAALLGTGLAVLAVSLGGIAGLSDDVRAASEEHLKTTTPTVTWEEQLDQSLLDPAPSTTPPAGAYDQDGESTVRGY